MAKSLEGRWWEWLRVGRRIELVSFLYGAFAFLVFAIPSTVHFWKDADQWAGAIILIVFLVSA